MIVSEAQIEVRYAETDMMGIVYHANYLPWLEIGRTKLLKENGFPYKEFEDRGLLLPVLEVGIKYKRPATYDDVITIKSVIKEKPFVKINIDYELFRGDDLIATAFSVHAFMNRNGQAIKAPKDFLDAMREVF